MALVMPRTDRRAYILLCMVPGRGDPSVRCRRCDHRLILTETRQALLMELRIGNRTTLFAHARLAESAVCFEEPIVTFALDDVLPGSIRTDGHGYDGRQASRREGQADRSLKIMTITCDEGPRWAGRSMGGHLRPASTPSLIWGKCSGD